MEFALGLHWAHLLGGDGGIVNVHHLNVPFVVVAVAVLAVADVTLQPTAEGRVDGASERRIGHQRAIEVQHHVRTNVIRHDHTNGVVKRTVRGPWCSDSPEQSHGADTSRPSDGMYQQHASSSTQRLSMGSEGGAASAYGQ
jgi:hypothetical protein